jgi:hypothetical protein
VSSRLVISHPIADQKVIADFILAQGNASIPILNLIGIIWGPNSSIVAVSFGSASPPIWLIPFTEVPVGQGYCLEVIDANSKEKLACAGPFEVIPNPTRNPGCFYPKNNDTVGVNVTPYGTTANPPITGSKMERGGVLLQNGTATPGLPANQWGQEFFNLTLGSNTTFTVTDGSGPTVVTGLKIQ